jgi:hypothetical protein
MLDPNKSVEKYPDLHVHWLSKSAPFPFSHSPQVRGSPHVCEYMSWIHDIFFIQTLVPWKVLSSARDIAHTTSCLPGSG